jgi:hypothetical protein
MADTPNYGLYKNPRFSVNHVAEYISADTAGQREAVIRSAKFPRKTAVIPYSASKKAICTFLGANSGRLSDLDEDLIRFETRLRREPDGWMKDEIRRNIAAIGAFKSAFTTAKAGRFRFLPGPTDMAMPLEGVRINARMDLTLTETTTAGVTYSGGVVMLIAGTDAARKKIDDRRKTVAALLFWGLQNLGGNFEPLEKLCLSFDVFGVVATPAPKAIERLRANIAVSCREAASTWDGVAPPPGYDGPDWR